MEKNHSQPSFVSVLVSHRKTRKEFLVQIDKLLDWSSIEKLIKQYYNKGRSADGRKSYPGILLFKMSLLQFWYGLSDYEVEDQCNDSISFSRFVGVPLEEKIPDHSVLSRFRTALTKAHAIEPLFEEINRQLTLHGLIVHTGSIVDASITSSPRRPRGKKEYEITEDRKENTPKELAGSAKETGDKTKYTAIEKIPKTKMSVKDQKGVDKEGAWVRKANKLYYGYKKHIATDENGMIQSVCTTAANKSDTKNLTPVIDKAKLKKGAWVKADKGYQSKGNISELEKRKLKARIMHKAQRNKPLSDHQKRANKLISKVRYKVERTFGSMKRWSGAGTARYIGKTKTQTQHLLEAIAHNLYRSPNLYFLKEINKKKERMQPQPKLLA